MKIAIAWLLAALAAALSFTVLAQPSCSLSASPAVVQQNEQTTLSYDTVATNLAVVDQGVGIVSPTVSGSLLAWVGGPETTFTMTVAGPGGLSTCSATVTVLPPPPATELLGCWNLKYRDVKTVDAARSKIKAPADQTVCFDSGQINTDGSQSYNGSVPGNYTSGAYAHYVPTMGHVTVGISMSDYSTQTFYYIESRLYFANGKEDRADGLVNGYHQSWWTNAPDMIMNGDSSFTRARGK